jgi:hypothetical protein
MNTTSSAQPTLGKLTTGKAVLAGGETTHDILHQRTHPLEVFFQPKSMAVIGAIETGASVGRTLLWNLVSNPFGGYHARHEWRSPLSAPGILLLVVCLPFLPQSRLNAQQGNEQVRDASGEYRFLTADDTLGLLEEEGKIKGYVDVIQGEEESDTVLSYPIAIGSREKNHITFKTAKIHQKYYRFSGTVERGKGHEEGDPDYLRLVGDLEIVTVKGDTGQEVTERRRVIFSSKGKSEKEP